MTPVHLDLEISSDLAELERARTFLKEVCLRHMSPPLDEESMCQLELALNEAAANIIEHAYHGRGDRKILIEAEAMENRLMFRLNHWGDAFTPPETVPRPSLEGSSDRGLGLFLIHNLVDEVTYRNEADGSSCVCLVKHRKDT